MKKSVILQCMILFLVFLTISAGMAMLASAEDSSLDPGEGGGDSGEPTPYCIYGYVKDSRDNPICGALIKVLEVGVNTTSSSCGYYSIRFDLDIPTSGVISSLIFLRVKASYRNLRQTKIVHIQVDSPKSLSFDLNWGTGGRYAIIVGISDYGYINDLSYCDEDATDWYNHLNSMGYECHIYGDGHTSNYPRYDGKATKATVRTAIQELANYAQAGDTVCFITSGHGGGNGRGSSYLSMWDCSDNLGCYYDIEIKTDIGGFASGVNIFVFIDHCYSGGIGIDLLALSIKQYIYCTTTCTQNGSGYDDSTHKNGAWTYYFLTYSWQQHYGSTTHQSMESIFSYALTAYPHGGGDTPQQYDGNTGSSFYLG